MIMNCVFLQPCSPIFTENFIPTSRKAMFTFDSLNFRFRAESFFQPIKTLCAINLVLSRDISKINRNFVCQAEVTSIVYTDVVKLFCIEQKARRCLKSDTKCDNPFNSKCLALLCLKDAGHLDLTIQLFLRSSC